MKKTKSPINRKPVLIKLPTRSSIKYRGKHPNQLRSMSYGSNDMGFVHLETLEGSRFMMERGAIKVWPSVFDKHHNELDTILRENDFQIIEMTQDEYDHFLGFVQALRRIRRTGQTW